MHSSVKAASADLYITSFQTQSFGTWHGESKAAEFGLGFFPFGLLVQAKYEHLWLPCDYRSNLCDIITKY